MDEGFELPVTYNGKELLFPAKLIQFGYSYRIELHINETLVSFEKDEDRNWRVLSSTTDQQTVKMIDQNLLTCIVQSLETTF